MESARIVWICKHLFPKRKKIFFVWEIYIIVIFVCFISTKTGDNNGFPSFSKKKKKKKTKKCPKKNISILTLCYAHRLV